LLAEKRGKHAPKQQFTEYPLTKKIICGNCGSTFKRRICNEKTYWVCRRHNSGIELCPTRQIPEPEIYAAFIRMYNKMKQNTGIILNPILTGLKELKAKSNVGNPKISEINRELAELANQNLTLKEISDKGYIDSDFFIRQSNEISAKTVKLKQQKSLLVNDDETDEIIYMTENIIEIIENGAKTLTKFDEALFDSIIEKIIARSQEEITFILRNGLQLKEKIERIKR
jgi:hypothetical protein